MMSGFSDIDSFDASKQHQMCLEEKGSLENGVNTTSAARKTRGTASSSLTEN